MDQSNKMSQVFLTERNYSKTCSKKVEEPTNIDCVWFIPRDIMF